jgi:phosphatidylserine decarboxylase
VNRAPLAGKVAYRAYRAGKFRNAMGAEATSENECAFVGLERPDGSRILVRQIAGLVARRIVTDCAVGDELHRGQRFGMVKFGSRLEVWLTLELPQGSRIMEVNPSATSAQDTAEGRMFSWNDMVLARFSVVFEVEESIDKEVGAFFTSAFQNFQATLNSQHGIAFLVILAILVGSYVYITIAKKKKEE